ncbi:hypothetical protein VaNZ11_001205 [Volvox africanus]|uniref:MRPL25 domain-containing protein n=1 Tax=Volvox africanus TaxID=51714 RepID=A0ABQ5RP55_9CHLO|nr:hypothetical protein VaNZ11_001205 [Volvox africanus]
MLPKQIPLREVLTQLPLPLKTLSSSFRHVYPVSTTISPCESVARDVTSVALDRPSTSDGAGWTYGSPKWDWKWVLGKSRGRKPAIRHPSRHQWYFCNPNYDANRPLPVVFRSPYAPPSAWETTDMAEYQRHLGLRPPKGCDLRVHRKEFTRFQKLRELDWREAFQRGVAEDLRLSRKAERFNAEARRQEAWRQYRDALFERARLAGEVLHKTSNGAGSNPAAVATAAAAAGEPRASSS